ncbi:hypothetical protein K474DRAFT_1713867 [Panus rudis PR-1116 ss-1]|nr:hypothetical protein K474DRAFT_1713867 [Panus rudis PR-1116 ss-1]
MYTQICRLKANKITIPNILQGMILLNALPQKWENLATVYLQMTDTDDIKFTDVRNSIIAHWEQVAPPASSHKLSAIKRKHNDPNFRHQQGHGQQSKQQQPQQQQSGNKYKKKQRSKRGGKGKPKGNTVEHQSHLIASSATAALPPSRLPLAARISEITPHGIHTREQPQLPAAFQYGAGNKYDLFSKTMATLESLGIDQARQPVASGSNVTLDDNPEPAAKRSRTASPAGSLFFYGTNLEDEMAADAETDFGQTYVVVDRTVRP